jgi:inositol phosphorylceramide mannosyltransferase catalytic subunit
VIPHIIHRIWLGSEPLPELFQRYGETWRHHHPDWEMHLWTDESLPELGCPEIFGRARSQAQRATVLRYELLRQLGGVYVDTDFECLRPLDSLIEGLTLFAGSHARGRVSNALFGAVPGHPAMERLLEEVAALLNGVQPDASGPGLFTRVLKEFPDVTVFGSEKFYPYGWEEKHRAGEEFPRAYAVHHWAGTGRERFNPAEEIERLRWELAKSERRRKKAEWRRQQLKKRLSAIETSAWWRLRLRLSALLRPLASVGGLLGRRASRHTDDPGTARPPER